MAARPLRDLLPVHDAPLTQVWRATDGHGTSLMLHVVRADLQALLPDSMLLHAQLSAAVGFDAALYRPLWVERLVDGRVAYDTPWLDRIPAVEAVREMLLPATALAETAANFRATLAELHRHGGVLGIITPASLAFLPGLNNFFVDGAGVFSALLAAGARRDDMVGQAGTRAHVAPELLVPGVAADARVDVYSAGSSLYELLTQRAPFGGRTTATMMVSVLVETGAGETADPEGRVGALVEALLRAIERDPDDRWPSMAAFAAALDGSTDAGWITTPVVIPRITASDARATGAEKEATHATHRSWWRAWLERLSGRP